MIQFNLQYPANDKIYFSKTPNGAAKKAFIDLKKKTNSEISRIIIANNNSQKNYEFIALTDNKVKQLASTYQSRNPIQLGGSLNINDDQFYDKINEISGNINLSVSELSKILNKKFKPNNEVILLLQDGISKIDNINHNISLIAESIAHNDKKNNTAIPNNIKSINETVDASNDIKSIEETVDNILEENKADSSNEIKSINDSNNDKISESKVETSDLEEISEESINLSTNDIKKNIKNDVDKLNSQKGCSIM